MTSLNLGQFRLLSTVICSVVSTVSTFFSKGIGSIWFCGHITGIAMVVIVGKRWHPFFVCSHGLMDAVGYVLGSTMRGGRLHRMLLLTALSSSITSYFGPHQYGATWNLEGIKLNTCNRSLMTETLLKQAVYNMH